MAMQASSTEASSTEKGDVPSVSNIYTKEEIVSPTPLLEQMQVKGWDSLEVLYLREQNQHSNEVDNCTSTNKSGWSPYIQQPHYVKFRFLSQVAISIPIFHSKAPCEIARNKNVKL